MLCVWTNIVSALHCDNNNADDTKTTMMMTMILKKNTAFLEAIVKQRDYWNYIKNKKVTVSMHFYQFVNRSLDGLNAYHNHFIFFIWFALILIARCSWEERTKLYYGSTVISIETAGSTKCGYWNIVTNYFHRIFLAVQQQHHFIFNMNMCPCCQITFASQESDWPAKSLALLQKKWKKK